MSTFVSPLLPDFKDNMATDPCAADTHSRLTGQATLELLPAAHASLATMWS